MAKTRSVLASKRVTGDSANTIMIRHIRMERCSEKGCKNSPYVTKNPSGTKKIRYCEEHIPGAKKVKTPSDLLSIPQYHARGMEAA